MSKLDGKAKLGNLKLAFNWNTLCELEGLWGLNDISEAQNALSNFGSSPKKIRDIFFAAMLEDQPDITQQEAGRLISKLGVDAVAEAIAGLMEAAFSDTVESTGGNVKPKRTAGK